MLHEKQKQNIATEMYLKAIYQLREELPKQPKPVDLVKKLQLSKGSVSEMLKKMVDEGWIHYESYGRITLTKKGETEAKNVVRKYEVIKKFLADVLKINPDHVEEEACNLEHAFSNESIAKLNIMMKFFEK